MTEYRPRYAGTVTKYVFIESPDLTPSDLAIRAYEISEGVMIKETCFGLQITGKEDEVNKVIEQARERAIPATSSSRTAGSPPETGAGAVRTSAVHGQAFLGMNVRSGLSDMSHTAWRRSRTGRWRR